MSSSFLSTCVPLLDILQAAQQPFAEAPIRLHGDLEIPAGNSQTLAFYRILFGHDDLVTATEREIRGAKGVVIRKRMRHETQSELAQAREKALGIADPGDRV